MGLKSWAREQAFKRAADALENASGKGGALLGWPMDQWKVWAEGLFWAVLGAVAGAVAEAVQSGQPLTMASFKGTAVAAAILAVTTYLRKSPSDPRRTTSSPTEGQVIDMASRVKGPDGPPVVVPAAVALDVKIDTAPKG